MNRSVSWIVSGCFGLIQGWMASATPLLPPEKEIVLESSPHLTEVQVNPRGKTKLVLRLPTKWLHWMEALPEEKKNIARTVWLSGQGKNSPADFFDLGVTRDKGILDIEYVFAVPGDYRDRVQIADRLDRFNDWMFRDINTRPDGGQYFLHLEPLSEIKKGSGPGSCLESKSNSELESFAVTLPYEIRFMTVHRRSVTRMQLYCGISGKDWKSWRIKNIPGGLVESADTEFILFSPDGLRTFGYGLTHLKLRRWVYELLPLRLMESQGRERLGLIVRNFRDHRQQGVTAPMSGSK